jgi:hypothetical protein
LWAHTEPVSSTDGALNDSQESEDNPVLSGHMLELLIACEGEDVTWMVYDNPELAVISYIRMIATTS